VFVSFQVVFFILKVGLRRDINIETETERMERRGRREEEGEDVISQVGFFE